MKSKLQELFPNNSNAATIYFDIKTDSNKVDRILSTSLESVYILNSQLVLKLSIPKAQLCIDTEVGRTIFCKNIDTNVEDWIDTLNNYSGNITIIPIDMYGEPIEKSIHYTVNKFVAGESIYDYTMLANTNTYNIIAIAKIVEIEK